MFPLAPFAMDKLRPERLKFQSSEYVLSELRPHFPGAVESWSAGVSESPGFHDKQAPHVRQRSRLWLQPSAEEWNWLEDAYVGAADAGLSPKVLEGLQAVKRFPGFASTSESYRGLLLPKFCDVDVSRYRNGILEFVRERIAQRFIVAATQIEPMPGGLRFYTGGKPCTARIQERVLTFWTPRMTSWILNQAKRTETVPRYPRGTRLWEQWSLISRDDLDPEVIGTYLNMVVWAEAEGVPGKTAQNRLSVLRSGPLLKQSEALQESGSNWASAESLNGLSSLCYDFLKWSQFSIRSMKPRAIFEWDDLRPWSLNAQEPQVTVVPGCDGPLVDVVRTAREATA
jgi:hypothetical protein